MKYNSIDNIWYCTNAERLAQSTTILNDISKDTAKFYEVDTKLGYIVYTKTWYSI